MADLYNLSLSDGAEEWRRKEAAELSDLVQRRLHYLQVTVTSSGRTLRFTLAAGLLDAVRFHDLEHFNLHEKKTLTPSRHRTALWLTCQQQLLKLDSNIEIFP